jgi:hypothetical protein
MSTETQHKCWQINYSGSEDATQAKLGYTNMEEWLKKMPVEWAKTTTVQGNDTFNEMRKNGSVDGGLRHPGDNKEQFITEDRKF